MENIQQAYDTFVDGFCEQLKVLVKHDFIAKEQSNYLKASKEYLLDNEIIVLMDFSENLSFDIQDAAQSYYYSKNQSTIHPICIYYRDGTQLKQQSIIIIAESLKHTVEAVYLFQIKLVSYLKVLFGDLSQKKIKYFTDGAASQYKNKKNFLNICLFNSDFGVNAEWHFFATSHGKSPCDALGGSFKRNARNFNMKNPMNGMTSAKGLYEWSQTIRDSKVHFEYCSENEYIQMMNQLNSTRFNQKIKTVQGTQSFHCFKPIDQKTIAAGTTSASDEMKHFTLIN